MQVVLEERGSVRAEATLEIGQESRVAGWPLPASTIQAKVTTDATGGVVADAHLQAREPGLPVALTGHLVVKDGAPVLTFDGSARARALSAVQRWRTRARGGATGGAREQTDSIQGSATLRARGVVDLGRGRVDTTLGIEATEVQRSGVRADRVSLQGRITGSTKDPDLRADLVAHGVEVAGTRWSEARAGVRGSVGHAALTAAASSVDGVRWQGSAALDLGRLQELRDVRVSVERGTDAVSARARAIEVGGDGFDTHEVTISGFDSPVHVRLASKHGVLTVRADGTDVELARAGRLAGQSWIGGHLALDADLALTSQTANGHLTLDLDHGDVGIAGGLSAHVDATAKDRRLSARVDAQVGEAARARVQAESLTVAGSQPLLASFESLWGEVQIDSELDLAKLDAGLVARIEHFLAAHSLSLSPNQGLVAVTGRIVRTSAARAMPSLELSVQASHLSVPATAVVSSRTNMSRATATAPSAQQLEGKLMLEVEGASGNTHVTAELEDATAPLVTLELSAAAVPYDSIAAHRDDVWTFLEAVPLRARLAVPRRAIDKFPGAPLPRSLRGEIGVVLEASGTLQRPSIDLVANVARGRIFGSGLGAPLDVDAHAHYDGADLAGELRVRIHDKPVLSAHTSVKVLAEDLWGRRASAGLRWEAAADLHFLAFPLETLRALEDRQVRGMVTGDVVVDGVHRDGRAKATLAATDLRIRDTAYGRVDLEASLTAGQVDGHLRYGHGSASAEARVSAGMRWGGELWPVPDGTHTPLAASLAAKRFPVGILLPWVDETLLDLDGDADGEIRLRMEPQGRGLNTEGTLALSHGSFELAGSRGGLHDIAGKLTVSPNGVVRLDDLTAAGTTGRLQADASARFDWYGLAEARAHAAIPSGSPLPLTIEGAGYGTVDGDLDVSMARSTDRRRWEVHANLPRLRVQLPATPTRTLQPLGALENLQVVPQAKAPSGTAAASPTDTAPTPDDAAASEAETGREPLPEFAPAEIKITVTLGKDVEVKRGNTFAVTLTGAPTITLRDGLDLAGQIQVLRGVIDVRGKSFDIEEGTISFVGDDPFNPQIVIAAGWNAPDGTRVYAHFVGPLKSGKVDLTSEPKMPKNDILSLLLFGTADGARANASKSGTLGSASAAGLAGSTAAQPLNRALQDFGLGGVSTRVDSSSSNPRPEVEVQIARDISLQVAWVLGATAPGSRPDRTLFTLDWRFVRRWSLQTTIGDAGTSILNLVWQFRY